MGHSYSSLRKSRRSALPVADTDATLAVESELNGKDHQGDKDGSDDKIKKTDNKQVKNDSQVAPHFYTSIPHSVPAPITRPEDYNSPTSHDDEGVQSGRLRALCPSSNVQEPPVHKVIASVLAKHAKSRAKPEPAGMARARRSKQIPRRRQRRIEMKMMGVDDTSTDIDVLAARALYNAACSPLCRLPDNLLVHIMCHLGWEDIWFLRHVSRVFMRLVSCRPELASVRDDDVGAMNGDTSLFALPTPWRPPVFPTHSPQLWSNLRQRSQTATFASGNNCAGCRAVPRQFLWMPLSSQFMHCTACRVDHPVALFSGRQMQLDKATTVSRVCIAHEGHVRLCDHKTVEWATVVRSLPGGQLNDFRNPSAEDKQNTFQVDPHLRIVCDHPSHGAYSHHGQPIASDSRTSRTGKSATQGTQLPPYERFAADSDKHDEANAERPSFVVHDMMVDGVKHTVITWSYTAHMDLTDTGDNTGCGDGAITAQAFRDRLHDLRKAHSPARYIAPPDHPDLLHELRCVDPERCGCLLYPGFQRIQRGGNNSRQTMVCRQHEVVRALHSRVSDIDHIRIRLVSCGRAPRCLKLVYTRTIRLKGLRICADPSPGLGRAWPPAMYLGRRLPQTFFFRRLHDATRHESVPIGWYQALDPASFSVTDDTDRQHIAWCRGRTCRLNPRYLRARPYNVDFEMNVTCLLGCEGRALLTGHQNCNMARTSQSFIMASVNHWGRWGTVDDAAEKLINFTLFNDHRTISD